MSLTLTSKPKQQPQQGLTLGVLYQIIDMGTHVNKFDPAKKQYKVRLVFELPDDPILGGERQGEPLTISKEYTLSLGKNATLQQHHKSWQGRELKSGDSLRPLLGKAGNLTIVHEVSQSGNEYAAIDNIAPLLKSQVAPQPFNELVYFEMDTKNGTLDWELFDKLPGWLQDEIKESPEYKEIEAMSNGTYQPPAGQAIELDDEIPFG